MQANTVPFFMSGNRIRATTTVQSHLARAVLVPTIDITITLVTFEWDMLKTNKADC